MLDAEREKLRAILAQAHEKDRRVHFWATPKNEAVWHELLGDGKIRMLSSVFVFRFFRFRSTRGQ